MPGHEVSDGAARTEGWRDRRAAGRTLAELELLEDEAQEVRASCAGGLVPLPAPARVCAKPRVTGEQERQLKVAWQARRHLGSQSRELGRPIPYYIISFVPEINIWALR